MTTPNPGISYSSRTPNNTAGIGKIAGYTKRNAFADPATLQGGPVNPAHENQGEQTDPYPWEAYGGAQGPVHAPLGIENELLGDDSYIEGLSAGQIFDDPEGDYTPYYGSHAAPFPKGYMRGEMSSVGPKGTAQKLEQLQEIESANTNAGASRNYSESLLAHNDSWVGFYNEVDGEDLVTNAPTQTAIASAGWGVNDHTSNPLAKRNEYGFESEHRHRRYATGSIPGNSLWLKAAGRPMVKTMPHTAILPTGDNSPFAGDNVMETFSIDGAILQDAPTQYTPPPTPYVTPAMQQTSDVPELVLF